MDKYRLHRLLEQLPVPLLTLKKRTFFVLFILVVLFSYFVVLLPKIEQLQQSNEVKENLDAQVKAQQLVFNSSTQIAKQEELRQQLTVIEQLVALQQPLLVAGEQKANSLVLIHRLATKHKLTLQRLRWQQQEEQQYFYLLPLEIKVIGTLNNVGLFLADIANLSMLLTFPRSRWAQYNSDNNTIVFEALGYGYGYQPKLEAQ